MNKKAAVCVVRETNTDSPLIPLCSLAAMVLCLLSVKGILGKQVQGFEDSVFHLCILYLYGCGIVSWNLVLPMYSLLGSFKMRLNRKNVMSCVSFYVLFIDLSVKYGK